MPKALKIGIGLVALLAGAYLALDRIPARLPASAFQERGRNPQQSVPVDLDKIARHSVNAAGTIKRSRDPGAAATDPFPQLKRSRAGMPLDGDPFVAASAEEQAWLDRNGFPNRDQLQTYAAASDALLAQAAANGDDVAKVTLDGRRLAQGDAQAAADLWNAGVEGSGYALGTLAAFLGGSQTYGDPGSAYALSRLAEMRGDYRQALGRDFVVRSPLSPTDRLQAEGLALRLLADYQQARRMRFGPTAAMVDPRPIAPPGP